MEAARKRLGGRASTAPGAGDLVEVKTKLGLTKPGVILFIQDDEVDIWIADDTVLRTTRDRTTPLPPQGVVPRDIATVASDARVFGSLGEGQRVRYLHALDDLADATLVEKCRYGALLLRDDGTLVGVGFRRVWPAVAGQQTN